MQTSIPETFTVWVLIITVVIAVFEVKAFRRGKDKLARWAEENRYEIVEARLILLPLLCPPFRWERCRGLMFRLTVSDSRGEFHTGYAFLPNVQFSFWELVFIDTDLDVKWDKYVTAS